MEIFELILKFIEAIKWPALILFILVYFKSVIVSLVGKLTELNIGGEKGFNLKLKAASKIAEENETLKSSESVMPAESKLILSLPDEGVIYLSELAKKPIKSKYYPASGNEMKLLHSLSEYGVMRQKSMSEFELTEIGNTLVRSLEKL